MIKCNSPHGYCKKCIIDCDSKDTLGGTIICDTAENFNFNREEILVNCEYAEPVDIHDAALKELYS